MESKNMRFEKKHLEDIVMFMREELAYGEKRLKENIGDLIKSNKAMWEEVTHIYEDKEALMDYASHLDNISLEKHSCSVIRQKVRRYRRQVDKPYFARLDFKDEYGDRESLYIGSGNVIDDKKAEILVYDWRSPIAGMFYQYEVGAAGYRAPCGEIKGEIELKRQFKIEESELKYCFDSDVKINDDVLQQILCSTASVKMKNIVETIQKEQDTIIRDVHNKLLMVQGTAGSGKTSVAMHRIAYLMYHGFKAGLSSKEIVIISPNTIFSKYISTILPELGEENVTTIIMNEFLNELKTQEMIIEDRTSYMERLLKVEEYRDSQVMKEIEFKGSKELCSIVDEFIPYYERKLKRFYDIYCEGRIIFNREELREEFLNRRDKLNMSSRLERMKRRVFIRMHTVRKERVERFKEYVKDFPEHIYEIPQLSRLLSMKRSKKNNRFIEEMINIDPFKIYEELFKKGEHFFRKEFGGIPENVKKIMSSTIERIESKTYNYEDIWVISYINYKVGGFRGNNKVKQVVVDEAQDYSYFQYKILKEKFKEAAFTILGDMNQSLDRNVDMGMFNDISQLMEKEKFITIRMNKSFRSTYEIVEFSKNIIGDRDIEAFERHGESPAVKTFAHREDMDEKVLEYLKVFKLEGLNSVAILCRDMRESIELQQRLKGRVNVNIIDDELKEYSGGWVIMPIFLSKGLEFDGVIIYDTSDDRYRTIFHRKALYVAATRGLHRVECVCLNAPSRNIKW